MHYSLPEAVAMHKRDLVRVSPRSASGSQYCDIPLQHWQPPVVGFSFLVLYMTLAGHILTHIGTWSWLLVGGGPLMAALFALRTFRHCAFG